MVHSIKGTNGHIYYSSRNLYNELNLKTRYNDWIKAQLKRLYLKDGDYIKANNDSSGGRPPTDIYINIDALISICLNNNSNESISIIKKIIPDANNLVVSPISQLEKRFDFLLTDFLYYINDEIIIERQVSVCHNKYIIDFIINGTIFIEYHEKYHKSQMVKDKKRQEETISYYNTPRNSFIRVREGEEIKGLSQVLYKLFEFGILDTSFNIDESLSFDLTYNKNKRINILLEKANNTF